jgi:hypothetical protein
MQLYKTSQQAEHPKKYYVPNVPTRECLPPCVSRIAARRRLQKGIPGAIQG